MRYLKTLKSRVMSLLIMVCMVSLSACSVLETTFGLGEGALDTPQTQLAATKIIYTEALVSFNDLYEDGNISPQDFVNVGKGVVVADMAIALADEAVGRDDAGVAGYISSAIVAMMKTVEAVNRMKALNQVSFMDNNLKRLAFWPRPQHAWLSNPAVELRV